MPDNAPRHREPKGQEEAIHEILRRVEEQLRQKLSIGGKTLDQIEEQSQSIGEEVKRIVEEESLQAPGYGGTFLRCHQGYVCVAIRDMLPVMRDYAAARSSHAVEHAC